VAAGILFVFLGLALLLRAISGNLPDRLLEVVGVEREAEPGETGEAPEPPRQKTRGGHRSVNDDHAQVRSSSCPSGWRWASDVHPDFAGQCVDPIIAEATPHPGEGAMSDAHDRQADEVLV
jgi:hypothetical protein